MGCLWMFVVQGLGTQYLEPKVSQSPRPPKLHSHGNWQISPATTRPGNG